jgi:inhibitor of KinA sporulation pathway (predicted exonuclease)
MKFNCRKRIEMKLFEVLLENLNLTIIDVESTCWKTEEEKGDQQSEVIEVGISNILKGKIQRLSSIIISPKHSRVSEFCTSLTTLTQEKVDRGMQPKNAYAKLSKLFVSKTWASWGDYDLNQLERMFELYSFPNVLPATHINIRLLFAQKIIGSENPKDAPNNPKDAMEKLGMTFKGINHRGDDDAYNIARLYMEIINFK